MSNREDRLLVREEVAALLRVPPSTLYEWRRKGVGPQSTRIGKRLVWRESDVRDYVAQEFKRQAVA